MSKRQQTLIYRFREKFAIAKDRHKIIAETYLKNEVKFCLDFFLLKFIILCVLTKIVFIFAIQDILLFERQRS